MKKIATILVTLFLSFSFAIGQNSEKGKKNNNNGVLVTVINKSQDTLYVDSAYVLKIQVPKVYKDKYFLTVSGGATLVNIASNEYKIRSTRSGKVTLSVSSPPKSLCQKEYTFIKKK